MVHEAGQQILLIAGDYDIIAPVQAALGGGLFVLHRAFNHREGMYVLANENFDLILVDEAMIDRYSSERTLTTVIQDYPDLPLIALSQNGPTIDTDDLPIKHVITELDPSIIRRKVLGISSSPTEPTLEVDPTHTVLVNAVLERRIDEIQNLFAVSKSLTEVLDLNEVLNRVVEVARRLTDAEEGMILLPGEDGSLYLRAKVGIDVASAGSFRVKTKDTIAGKVFSTGLPAMRGLQGLMKLKTEYLVKSLLYVPILLEGDTIGVLGVNNRVKDAIFEKHHQELLLNLASYAAVAIKNARTHEESLQRATELEMMVEASQVINSSLSMDKILVNICKQLAHVLDVNRTEIYEWDKADNLLRSLARFQKSVWRLREGPSIQPSQFPKLQEGLTGNQLFWVTQQEGVSGKETDYIRSLGVKSMVVFPIRTGNQLLGTLNAFFIDTPKNQSMPASERHQLYVKASDILNESIANPKSPISENIYPLMDEVNHTFGADWSQLTVYIEGHDELSVCAEIGSGNWSDLPGPYFDLSQNPDLQKTLLSKSVINLRSDPATVQTGAFALLEKIDANAILALPLIRREEVQGLVVFVDTVRNRDFYKRDVDVGRTIIEQASTALENARLVHDLERSLQELRDTQERLVQTARLTAIGELAAVVAHQINNPLTTIIVDAELMLADEPKDTDNFDALSAIVRAGKRAASVARRLLSISRPDDPESPPEAIDLIDTINGVVTLVKTHIERDGTRVITKFPEQPIPPVLAVKGQLEDVWLNLMTNAHDALGGQEDARIGIEVHIDEQEHQARVIVQDNGPGIPDERLTTIFKPFFTTKLPDEGTGLGLYICQQAVERSGGEISVKSSVGNWTRFEVRLPIIVPEKM